MTFVPWHRLLPIWLAVLVVGCSSMTWNQLPSPIKAGYNPVEVIDPPAQEEASRLIPLTDLVDSEALVRAILRPEVIPPQKNILVISGGGVYGSYCAGVLVGWSCAGTRPEFDVVTGISTGALIAPLAFLGPKYDEALRTFYTSLSNRDLFRIRRSLRAIISESVADNTRMKNKIAEVITPEFLAEVAAEHRKGRRLYIGTTELESRRPVTWDMGEIACRGTPADLQLFRDVILASTAIPGFFPAVKIRVTVDGQLLEEKHIDGGVSASLFFRSPYFPEDGRPMGRSRLYDSNLYVLVAGKLFQDPEAVNRANFVAVAANSVSSVIYSQTRGDVIRLYTIALLLGLNFNLEAIPPDFPAPTQSTNFDPVEMTKMFNEGYQRAMSNRLWRKFPPGFYPEERPFSRRGTNLANIPLNRPVAQPDRDGIGPLDVTVPPFPVPPVK